MVKVHLLFVFLLCTIFGLYQSVALGGDVTLSIATSTTFIHKTAGSASVDLAAVKVTITNKGNDTARKVAIQAHMLDSKQTVFVADQILPDASVATEFTLPVPSSINGAYPIFLDVLYEHSDGHAVATAAVAELRTADNQQRSPLTLNSTQKLNGKGNTLTVHISTQEPGIKDVELTCHAPGDLTVDESRRRIRLTNGTATTSFNVAGIHGVEGRYAVYVVAEADLNGLHTVTSSSAVVPVEPIKTFFDKLDRKNWQQIGYGALLLTLLIWLVPTLRRKPGSSVEEAGQRDDRKNQMMMDALLLMASIIFVLINLTPHYLFTQTTTTGGDTASHYYTLDYLRRVLLPLGKISGWTMGNYAGFPLLQFYFPLSFLLMCLLGVAIPLQVAFKIVSIFGSLLLPVGAYFLLRGLRRPFPAPILGAIFTLPFLFHSANSMWGGNILSTLAGEFSYSLSFSLSFILLGTLYYGARNDRWVIGNALLVFLVGFSHGYTLLFVEAMSIFFLITHEGFIRRLGYLLKVYTLGFLLLAFWLVPLLVFTRLTTSYHMAWMIDSWREILPPQILPFAILAGVGSVLMLTWSAFRRPDSELVTAVTYLCTGLVVSGLFFIAAPKLGVVDIRYVPYGQILVCLLAALFLGWLTQFMPRNWRGWMIPIFCLLGVFLWVGGNPGPAPSWAKWNYEGFEAKPAWPIFEEINTALKGSFSAPRVVYEHSEDHGTFGSSRAFESLPLFAGRATLEGLYMQASISAPFVFYLQSEVSAVKSAPFPQYTYTNMDFERALPHLRLFNVGDLVIRSDGAKKAIRAVKGYQLKKTVGDYELWEVTSNTGRYVEPLVFEPVLLPSEHWKTDSYRWFMNEQQLDVHLAFSDDATSLQPDRHLKVRSSDLTSLPRIPIDTTQCQVKETIGNDEIKIETNWIGKPLLVKVSYHPNWQVEGADKIYLVSPSFMLIYPTQTTVRLHYGRGWPDRVGASLSILGLVLLLLNLPLVAQKHSSKHTTAWCVLAGRLHIPPDLIPVLRISIPLELRKKLLLVIVVVGSLATGWLCYHIYTGNTNRIFNEGVHLKDAKQFDQARAAFRTVVADQDQTLSNLGQESAYYIAICYYLENKDSDAIAAFRKLISVYPTSQWVPEAYYHIGLIQFRSGQTVEGISTMNQLIHDYPGVQWANYAKDRLAEKKVINHD